MSYTVLIVLGSSLDSFGKITLRLKERLDKILKIYSILDEKKAKIIVSGGCVYQKINSQAKVMADYLIERGIPSKDVILENKSINTLDNIYYSNIILKNLDPKKIIIVSSDFHINRTKYICSILMKDYNKEFEGSDSVLPYDELEYLKNKEVKIIEYYRINFSRVFARYDLIENN